MHIAEVVDLAHKGRRELYVNEAGFARQVQYEFERVDIKCDDAHNVIEWDTTSLRGLVDGH